LDTGGIFYPRFGLFQMFLKQIRHFRITHPIRFRTPVYQHFSMGDARISLMLLCMNTTR
jgi:hypothetical protein